MQLRLGVRGRARTHATLPLVAQHYAGVQQRMELHKPKLSGAVIPPAELVRSPNTIGAGNGVVQGEQGYKLGWVWAYGHVKTCSRWSQRSGDSHKRSITQGRALGWLQFCEKAFLVGFVCFRSPHPLIPLVCSLASVGKRASYAGPKPRAEIPKRTAGRGCAQEKTLQLQLPSTMMAVMKLSSDALSVFLGLSRTHLNTQVSAYRTPRTAFLNHNFDGAKGAV
jgi:hypothetical protein